MLAVPRGQKLWSTLGRKSLRKVGLEASCGRGVFSVSHLLCFSFEVALVRLVVAPALTTFST